MKYSVLPIHLVNAFKRLYVMAKWGTIKWTHSYIASYMAGECLNCGPEGNLELYVKILKNILIIWLRNFISNFFIFKIYVEGYLLQYWLNVVHWRREWQTTSVFLPWEPHEQYEKAKW